MGLYSGVECSDFFLWLVKHVFADVAFLWLAKHLSFTNLKLAGVLSTSEFTYVYRQVSMGTNDVLAAAKLRRFFVIPGVWCSVP